MVCQKKPTQKLIPSDKIVKTDPLYESTVVKFVYISGMNEKHSIQKTRHSRQDCTPER